MIPYDDLVVALTAWRTRQGLPVSAVSAVAAAPPPAHAAPATPARPAAARPAPAPMPMPMSPDSVGDFEDGALVEDASYDAGEDYVMQLGAVEHQGEATAIGAAPEPAPSARRGKRPDGW
jgi:hypothetical protein